MCNQLFPGNGRRFVTSVIQLKVIKYLQYIELLLFLLVKLLKIYFKLTKQNLKALIDNQVHVLNGRQIYESITLHTFHELVS